MPTPLARSVAWLVVAASVLLRRTSAISVVNGLAYNANRQASKRYFEESDKGYSTNALCRQYNCINPVFPGFTELAQLEATTYQCEDAANARQYMEFCKSVVYYDIAIPNPPNTTTLKSIVTAQDNAAATTYFYHLAGMNMDAWEYRQPELSDSDCVKSILTMVCNTYFPKADAGCHQGQGTPYSRPCRNVCESYVKSCQVQCCDESVQCVFRRNVSLIDGGEREEMGYADTEGPDSGCTGDAPHVAHVRPAELLMFVFLIQLLLP